MKHLPKHLRPRYRYLAVGIEAWPDAELDERDFQRAVWEETRALLGDAGSAEVDPTVMQFSFADGAGEAIVRVRHDEVECGRAALACLDGIQGEPIGLVVRGVSGTIRACEEKYMGARPEGVDERTVAFENASRTGVVRDGRVDVPADDAFVGATDLDLR